MLRLAHRILTERCFRYGNEDESALNQDVSDARDVISELPLIIADNVAALYESNLDRKQMGAEDFPACVPPFRECFVEHPGIYHVYPGTNQKHRQFSMIGSLITCTTWNDDDAESIITPNRTKAWNLQPDDIQALCGTSVFASLTDGRIFRLGIGAWIVRNDGTTDERIYWKTEWKEGSKLGVVMYPTMMTISLMNCKNVIKQDVTDTEGPADKWLRRMKQPKLRYHVLNIEPMKQVLRTEGGFETNGLKKALHICRGHFATYTDDKPLFGRVTGTFWKPAHVRGSIEHGAVVKDYAVKV